MILTVGTFGCAHLNNRPSPSPGDSYNSVSTLTHVNSSHFSSHKIFKSDVSRHICQWSFYLLEPDFKLSILALPLLDRNVHHPPPPSVTRLLTLITLRTAEGLPEMATALRTPLEGRPLHAMLVFVSISPSLLLFVGAGVPSSILQCVFSFHVKRHTVRSV